MTDPTYRFNITEQTIYRANSRTAITDNNRKEYILKQKIRSSIALLKSKAYTLITDKEIIVDTKKNSDLDNVMQLHSLKNMLVNLKQYIKDVEKSNKNMR